MHVFHRALHRGVLLAGLIVLVTPRLAWTQCEIFGPTEVCGAPIELCAPGGGIYEWTGPLGFTAATQCIEVTQPGEYSLRYFDSLNGLWFGPCSQVVTGGDGPAATIAGPASACEGAAAELCGPEGDLLYQWTGPGGFAANTRCVTVTASGSYQLAVGPAAGGCSGAPATHTLAFASCDRPAAPACPKPPSWWLRQCAGGRVAGFAAGSMAGIARCVEEKSGVVDGSRAGSLCNVLRQRHDLRARAKRHVAAVWASVCAGEIGVAAARGAGVSLDRATPIELTGVRTTVGEWLDHAERTIADLERRRLRDRAVKHAYREIVRVGWHIDHGLGIGATCVAGNAAGALAEDVNSAIETADDGASLGLSVSLSARSTEVGFAVDSDTFEEVSIAIFDVAGRNVADLAHGPYAPGEHRVSWDGRLRDGTSARSGVYFIRGRIRDQVSEQRVTVLR